MCLYKLISHYFPIGALSFSQTCLFHPLSWSPHSWCQPLEHQFTKGRRNTEPGEMEALGEESKWTESIPLRVRLEWEDATEGALKCYVNNEKLQKKEGGSWSMTFSGWLACARSRCFDLDWPEVAWRHCFLIGSPSLSSHLSLQKEAHKTRQQK